MSNVDAECAHVGLLIMAQQKALNLVYWRDTKESAAVISLGVVWFALLGWGYSTVTLLAYVALFHLISRFVYRNGCRMLGDLNLIEKRQEPVAPPTFVTEEEVQQSLATVTACVNTTINACFTLAVCDCNPLVFKSMSWLCTVAFASRVLGSTGFFFVVFASAFTLPKLYESKKTEIDQMYERFMVQALKAVQAAGRFAEDLKKKLPAIPKASDLNSKPDSKKL